MSGRTCATTLVLTRCVAVGAAIGGSAGFDLEATVGGRPGSGCLERPYQIIPAARARIRPVEMLIQPPDLRWGAATALTPLNSLKRSATLAAPQRVRGSG